MYFDLKFLVSNSSIHSVFSGLIMLLTQLLIVIHLSRLAGSAEVGILTLTVSITSLFKVFDIFGSSHTARLIAKFKDIKNYIGATLLAFLIINFLFYGFLGTLTFLLIGNIFHEQLIELYGVESLSNNLVFGVLILLANSILLSINGVIDALNRTYIRLFNVFFSSFVMLFIYFNLIEDPSSFTALIFLSFFSFSVALLNFIYIFYSYSVKIESSLRVKNIIADLFSYGYRVHISNISGMAFDPLFKSILGSIIGINQLGIYELASRSVTFIKGIYSSAFMPIIPKFVREFNSSGKETIYLNNLSVITLISSTFIFSFLILLSGFLSTIFLGYSDKTFVFISIIAATASYINIIFSPLYIYMQANNYVFWNNVTQLGMAIMSFAILFYLNKVNGFEQMSFYLSMAILSLLNFILNFNYARQIGLKVFNTNKKMLLQHIISVLILITSIFIVYGL